MDTDHIGSVIAGFLASIIGLAIVAVVVSNKSSSANVISTALSGFGTLVTEAITPSGAASSAFTGTPTSGSSGSSGASNTFNLTGNSAAVTGNANAGSYTPPAGSGGTTGTYSQSSTSDSSGDQDFSGGFSG